MLAPGLAPATKVVCLTEVVTLDELKDDNDYEDILEDMRTECGKFGNYSGFPFLFRLKVCLLSRQSSATLITTHFAWLCSPLQPSQFRKKKYTLGKFHISNSIQIYMWCLFTLSGVI